MLKTPGRGLIPEWGVIAVSNRVKRMRNGNSIKKLDESIILTPGGIVERRHLTDGIIHLRA